MNNLKKYRLALGLSQYQLAERTGILRTTLNRIETGALPMTMKMANRLSPFFSCTPDELIGEDRIRAHVLTGDKGYTPSFNEAFNGFVSSFAEEYSDAVGGDKPNDAFKDGQSAKLYELARGLTALSYDDVKKVLEYVNVLSKAYKKQK